MTQMQHTHGPWALDNKTDSITWGNTAFDAPLGAGGFVVASHSVCKIPRHQVERLNDEHRANAHLIAAAPELLAAAQRALGLLEELRADDLDDLEDVTTMNDLRDAIAKAQGGAS